MSPVVAPMAMRSAEIKLYCTRTAPVKSMGNAMSPPPRSAVLFFGAGMFFLCCIMSGCVMFCAKLYGMSMPGKSPVRVWNFAMVIMCLLFQTAYMS